MIEIDWVRIPGGKFLVGLSETQKEMLREHVRREYEYDRVPSEKKLELEAAIQQIHQNTFNSALLRTKFTTNTARAILRLESFLQQFPSQEEMFLKEFYISRFPITRKSFGNWLQKIVSSEADFSPYGWDFPYPDSSLPVFTSWQGANAFCHSVNGRLPTEHEWEKAARGVDGRLYPWGDEWDPRRGNFYGEHNPFFESEKPYAGHSTPVDAFPEGVSPYGIWDMAGNAFDWTQSQVGDESYVLKSCYPRFEKWYWSPYEFPKTPWLDNLIVNGNVAINRPEGPHFGTGFRPVRDQWPRQVWRGRSATEESSPTLEGVSNNTEEF